MMGTMLNKETFAAFDNELEKIALTRQGKNIIEYLEKLKPGATKLWRKQRVRVELPEFTERYLQKHKSLLPKETVKKYQEVNLAPTFRQGRTGPWTRHVGNTAIPAPMRKGLTPQFKGSTYAKEKLPPWAQSTGRPKWSRPAKSEVREGTEIPLRRFVFDKYFKRTAPGAGGKSKWVGAEAPTKRRYENIISKAEDQSKKAIEKSRKYKREKPGLLQTLGIRKPTQRDRVDLEYQLDGIMQQAKKEINALPSNVGYSPFYGRLGSKLKPEVKLSLLTRGHTRGMTHGTKSRAGRVGSGLPVSRADMNYYRGGGKHTRSGRSAPVDVARSQDAAAKMQEFVELYGTKAVPREEAIAKKFWTKATKEQFRKDKRKALGKGWEFSWKDLWTRPGTFRDAMVEAGPVAARFKTTKGRMADIKAQLARTWTGLHGAKKKVKPQHPKGHVVPLLSRRYSVVDPTSLAGKGKKGLMFRGTADRATEHAGRSTDPHMRNVFMTRHPDIATGYGASSAWRGYGPLHRDRPRLEVYRAKKLKRRGETPHLAQLGVGPKDRALIEELRKLPPDSLRALALGKELKQAGRMASGAKPTYEDVINLRKTLPGGDKPKARKSRASLKKAFLQGYEIVPRMKGKTPVGLELVPVNKAGEKGQGVSFKRLLEVIS
jgi:hypothetical protein